MTYLFTYSISGKQNGMPITAIGSSKIKSDSDKITVESIYGKDGAIENIKDSLRYELDELEVCPTGWFKFDEE